MQIVYFIERTSGLIKIGKTINPALRFVQHGLRKRADGCPRLIGVAYGYTELECELHLRFAQYRSYKREEFALPAEAVSEIKDVFGPRDDLTRWLIGLYGGTMVPSVWLKSLSRCYDECGRPIERRA